MANESDDEKGKELTEGLEQGQPIQSSSVAPDGTINIPECEAKLKSVDVADVDLLLGFSDDTSVIIPNGALDAISDPSHPVVFVDKNDSAAEPAHFTIDHKSTLGELFEMVGITKLAKAGSLRMVSENVDAPKAKEDEDTAKTPDNDVVTPSDVPITQTIAAPAPLVKTGQNPGYLPIPNDQIDAPDPVVPIVSPRPSVYRAGQKIENLNDPAVPTVSLDASITADDIINIAEAGGNVAITGKVAGDAQVGDTVTLTVNSKTFTGLVLADKTFSIAVAGTDLVADGDMVIDASITTTLTAGKPGTATATEGYSVDVTAPVPTINLDSKITADDIINVAEAGGSVAINGTVGGNAQVGDTVTVTVNSKTSTGLVQVGNTFSINVNGSDLIADADKVIDVSIATTDGAGNPGTATDSESYTVDLTTSAPVVTAGQTFSYAENQLAGAVVATVAATDDKGITGFRFNDGSVTGTTSADGFYTIAANGQISITAAGIAAGVAQNDFETGPNSFTYVIEAGDAEGNWSAATTIGLNVTNVDEVAPVVTAGQIFSYTENQVANTVIATVAATDAVGVNGFRFSETGTDVSGDGYYTIAVNGQISITAAGAAAGVSHNDFDIAPNSFTYGIEACDAAGNWSAAETVSLDVTVSAGSVDITAPMVTSGQTFSYAENQTAGSVIATVAATDAWGVTGFRFSNGTVTSDDGFFTIEANGQISITAAGVAAGAHNDFETTPNSFSYGIEAGDAAGNWSLVETVTLNVSDVDEIAPSKPVVSAISTDSGTVGDHLTKDATLIFSGIAEANSSVEVFVNGTSIGITIADGTGSWSFDHSGKALPDGTYGVTAQATDVAGNISAASDAYNVTIDTAAPAQPVVTAITTDSGAVGDHLTNDATLIFSGTAEANSSVEVFVDGASVGTSIADGTGAWSFDNRGTTLSNGSTYSVTAQATDLAGNTGALSNAYSVTIDISAPSPTITLAPNITADDIINIAEAGGDVAITGTVGGDAQVGDTVTLTVNGVDSVGLVRSDMTFSINVLGSDLAADVGTTIIASITTYDAAGNPGTVTASERYTVDIIRPTVSSIVASDLLITDVDSGTGTFSIDVTFSETMDTAIAPILTLNPAVTGSLTLAGGSWDGTGTVYTATYNVSDANVTQADITVDVTGAQDANGNIQQNYTPVAEFSIDTANPTVTSVLASDLLLTDADTGLGKLSIDVTFSEAMDISVAPTLTLNPAVATSVAFASGSWDATGTIYTATYNVSDANVAQADIKVDVTGAQDAYGNAQQDYTPVAELNIDTVNPMVTEVTASDLMITDADTGLGKLSIAVTFSETMDTAVAPTLTLNPAVATSADFASGSWDSSGTIYTAIYNVSDANVSQADITVEVTGAQDAVGNAQQNYTAVGEFSIDTVNPTVTSVVASDLLLTDADTGAGKTFSIDVTFSEAMDTSVAPTLTLNPDVATSAVFASGSWDASGTIYTATYNVSDANMTQADITVEVTGAQDAVGNIQQDFTADAQFSIDTENPSVTVAIVGGSLSDGGNNSLVTFTFSEIPTGFTAGDITTVGGSISGLTQDLTSDPSGKTYTALFTANDGFTGTGSVTVTGGSYTDASLNLGITDSDTVTIDTVNPTVTAVTASDLIITDADKTFSIAVTFSEAMDTAVAPTLTLNPAVDTSAVFASGSWDSSGTIYTATYNVSDVNVTQADITVEVTGAQDAVGNAQQDYTALAEFSIDTVNPTVTSVVTSDLLLTDADTGVGKTFSIDVTFSEAMDTSVAPTLTMDPAVATSVAFASGSWNAAGTIYTATYNVSDVNVTQADITVDVSGAQDANGNAQPDYTAFAQFSIDTENPSVTVAIVESMSDGGNNSLVTFTFSEVPTGFAAGDITTVGGSISGLTQDLVADPSGKTYTALFTANDGFTGTGSVTVTGGSYTDASLNLGITGSDTVNIDTVNPTVIAVTASDLIITDADTGLGKLSIDVTFSEVMDISVAPTLTLNPAVATNVAFASGSWDVSGMIYTATYNVSDANVDLADITVDVTGAQDVVGNVQQNYTPVAEFSIDTVNPTVTNVTVSDPIITDADTGLGKLSISVTFSEAMNTAVDPTLTLNPAVDTSAVFASGSWDSSGTIYTATYNVSDANVTQADITVDVTGAVDANGNAQQDYTPVAEFSIDTVNPTVTDVTASQLMITDADTGAGKTFSIDVTFSEAMDTAVTPTLTLNPAVDTSIAFASGSWDASGTIYTATYNVSDANMMQTDITVEVTGAQDAVGNAQQDYTALAQFSIDTENPSVTVAIVGGVLSDGDNSFMVTFAFSEVPMGFAAVDITPVGGAISGLTQDLVADPSGKTYTALFTASDGFTGTGSVSVTAGSYTDIALNLGVTGSDTVTIDTVNPTVTDVTASNLMITDDDTGTGKTYSIAVTFSEVMDTAVAPTLTLNPAVDSSAVFASGSWDASGTIYTATYNVSDANVTQADITVDVTGAQDASGNAQQDYTPVAELSIDTVNPTVTNVTASDLIIADADTGLGKLSIALTFSETMDTTVAPTLTLNPDVATSAVYASGSWDASGTIYTATYNVSDADVTQADITVEVTGAQDAVGNTQQDFTADAQFFIDTENPSVTVAIAGGLLSDGGNNSLVTFTFSEIPNGFAAGDITTIGGSISGLTQDLTSDPSGKTYTALFTASDGFTGTGSVTVNGGSYTDAALNLGITGSDTVNIDTGNPTVTAVTASDLIITDADTGLGKLSIDVTFSEAMDTAVAPTLNLNPMVDTSAVFASGSWDASGTIYTATYNVSDANVTQADITIDVTGAMDANGNAQQEYTAVAEFSIDTINPTVTDVTASDLMITDADTGAGKTFSIDVTFSEAMETSVAPTLTLNPAVATSVAFATGSWDASGTIYTATYNVSDDGVDLADITVDVTGAQDAVGNAQQEYTAVAQFNIDTVNPMVNNVLASAVLLTDAHASNAFSIDVTFSETMNTTVAPTLIFGTDVSDSLAFVSGSWDLSGTVYTTVYTVIDANVTQSNITVDVIGAQDANGNAQQNYTAEVEFGIYTKNTAVTDVRASDLMITDADAGAGKTFNLDVTFNEVMDTTVDPTLIFGDNVTGSLTLANGVWNTAGTVYTATYNVSDINIDLANITVDVTGAQDTSGNVQQDYSPSAEFSISTVNPTVTSVLAGDSLLTDADTGNTFSINVTFSEAMNTGVAPTLTLNPDVATSVVFASGSWNAAGTIYTATYNVSDANVDVAGITVDVTGAQDAVGNAQQDYTAAIELSIDTENPMVTVAIVGGSLSDGDNSSLVTFTFSEVPTGFAAGDISTVGGSISGLTQDLVEDPSGNTYTALFTANDGFTGTGSVTVTGGSYTDAVLNLGVSGSGTVTIDTENPTVTVTIVNGSLSDGGNSSEVIFTFSEVPTDFAAGDITTVGGSISGLTQDLATDPSGKTYTATFTANDDFTGTGSVSLPAESYTDAALNLGGTGSDTVAIDTVNPMVGSVVASDPMITDADTGAGKTFSIDVTFSEAMNTAVAPTLTLNPAIATSVAFASGSWNAAGTIYTATYNVSDANVSQADIMVDVTGALDANGNAQQDYIAEAEFSIDTENPTVTVAIADGSLNDGDNNSQVTFTFSEVPTGFATGDITTVGGSISGLTQNLAIDPSGKTYTATFTANDSFTGTGSVSVTTGSYTDTALNLGVTNTDTVMIDTINPTVTAVTASDLMVTDADTGAGKIFSIAVTFSETMDTLVVPTLTLNPAVATSAVFASGSWDATGTIYTATYNFSDANVGVAGITVDVTGAQDANGNAQQAYTAEAEFSIDTVNPTVTAVTASDLVITDADTGVGKTISLDVVFSEAMDKSVAPTLTLNPAVATSVVFANGSWNPAGTIYTATYNIVDANVTQADITVDVTGAQDANGNLQQDYIAEAEFGIDTVNPTVTTVTASDLMITDADTGAGKTFSIDVTFSEAMNTAVAPTLTLNPAIATSVAFTSGSWNAAGTIYTATYNVSDANVSQADITVDVTGALDANGNAQQDYIPEAEFSIDTENPTVTVAIADGSLSDGDNNSQVTFTFSEVPTGFATGDITTVGGSISGLTQNLAIDPSGKTYTATFTANDSFTGTGSVSVTSGSYTDTALNLGVTNTDTVMIDTINPTVTAVTASDLMVTDADTGAGKIFSIAVTFSETMDTLVAPTLTLNPAVDTSVAFASGSWNAAGTTYTATYSVSDANVTQADITVDVTGAQDANGNAQQAYTAEAEFSIDTVNPMVTITGNNVDGIVSKTDKVVTYTLTFSEAVQSVTESDLTISGGTLTTGPILAADRLSATFLVTANDNSTENLVVTVNDSIVDLHGNTLDPASNSLDVNTVNPTVTINVVDPSLNNIDSSSLVTFTFSAVPVGFSVDDIAPVGGTISGLTQDLVGDPSGRTYTATFTANESFTGTGLVSVTAESYTDTALNLGVAGSDTVTIDTVNPTVTAVTASELIITDADTGLGKLSIAVTFSEVMNVAIEPTLTLNPAVATSVDFANGSWDTAGTTYTATYNVSDANVTQADITVDVAGALDVNGNTLVDYAAQAEFSIDTKNPTVTIDIVDPSLNLGDKSSSVTFTFSEPPINFDVSGDITVVGGSLSSGTWNAGGTIYTTTFTADNNFTGTGLVSVGTAWQDSAGNTGAGGSDTVAIDTQAPIAPTVKLEVDSNDNILGTFIVSGNEPGALVEYRLNKDGTGFDLWNSASPTISTAGSYVLEVRQTDAAGNTSNSNQLTFKCGDYSGETLSGDGILIGRDGNDIINGGIGNDTLYGDLGNDILIGGAGGDEMHGGSGIDTVSYVGFAGDITASLLTGLGDLGDATGDHYIGIENLIGGDGNDTIIGDNNTNTLTGGIGRDILQGMGGNDFLYGDIGNDTLIGGSGGDRMYGGDGDDTASYVDATSGVWASLHSDYWGVQDTSLENDAKGDKFYSIEDLTGSAFGDTLYGDANDNTLAGGLGDDNLVGLGGNDTIYGGDGADTIYANQGMDSAYGEDGNDTFYVSSLLADLPTIIDGGARDAGGGNTLVLQDFVNGSSYDLTALAGVTRNIDTLDVKDGVSTAITISSQDIQNMVGNLNSSELTIKVDGSDSLVLSSGTTIDSSFVPNVTADYTIHDGTQTAVIHWIIS